MAEEIYYLGSDLKFEIEINASGFDQNRDNYDIDIYCKDKKISFTQDDIKTHGSRHYLPVNTDLLRAGPMKIVVTAKVPDGDFETHIRREIDVKGIGTIRNV